MWKPAVALSKLTFDQPKGMMVDLPYEIKFSIHPPHEEFCISKIIILSEARNLELYIKGSYEKSSRGIMLTMNKGRSVVNWIFPILLQYYTMSLVNGWLCTLIYRKLYFFEAEFDLSSYTKTISKATIKVC